MWSEDQQGQPHWELVDMQNLKPHCKVCVTQNIQYNTPGDSNAQWSWERDDLSIAFQSWVVSESPGEFLKYKSLDPSLTVDSNPVKGEA